MTTDSEDGLSNSEEGLSNSDGGSLSRQEIETLIQKEVRKELKRAAAAGATEPVMKRVRKGSMMEREMRVVKREMREMKRLIQNLTRNAPADRKINPRTSLDHHQITRSEEGKFQLVFVSKLHDSIFTKDKIKDENGEYVEIKLIDTIRRETVDAGDHLSSIEIEIVVLEGDFGLEGNWTEQEFNAKIVNKKGDKEPLLVKGNQVIKLKNGVGTIDDLSFFSNSSWTKSGKFRLGARVLQSNSRGQMIRIKEAKSEAFAVKHLRGKMTHLKKIKEGGKFHKALIENNIHTASDLKQMCKTNRDKLKEILKGCSKWEWDAIVQHAIRVVDDDNSNPLRSQEAEAYNSATTVPPLRDQFQSIHQGSTGTQNNSNLASSSSPYKSTAHPTEPVQHFSDLQPPANMPTPPSQVDAQFEPYMAMPPYNIYDGQALLEQYTLQSYNV